GVVDGALGHRLDALRNACRLEQGALGVRGRSAHRHGTHDEEPLCSRVHELLPGAMLHRSPSASHAQHELRVDTSRTHMWVYARLTRVARRTKREVVRVRGRPNLTLRGAPLIVTRSVFEDSETSSTTTSSSFGARSWPSIATRCTRRRSSSCSRASTTR